MRTPAAASTFSRLKSQPVALTRRAFLRALGLACVAKFRPLVALWTAVPDDFDWLMRWCSRTAGPSFAAA